MTRTNLRTYTPGLRAEEVIQVLKQGLLLEAAAQRLLIPKRTLSNWIVAAKCGSTPPVSASGSCSVAKLEDKITRLRRALAIELMEKEVLKKQRRTVLESRCSTRN